MAILAVALATAAGAARAEEIGEVTTAIKLLGANHRIVVEAFDDPKVEGVACFISRARTGGISGSLGIAEDTSDASINCQQTGPIRFRERARGRRGGLFRRAASILFKRIQVVRFHDKARNALVYLTYSDKLVDGSPKNSVSAVVIRDWQTAAPSTPRAGPVTLVGGGPVPPGALAAALALAPEVVAADGGGDVPLPAGSGSRR